jgi:hypothetical protein
MLGLLAVSVMAAVKSYNVWCSRTSPSNETGMMAILAFPSFVDRIPHKKVPEISVVIFAPREDNRTQILIRVNPESGKRCSYFTWNYFDISNSPLL